MSNANAINYFSAEKWVVSKVAGEGTHTTWAAALADASAGDTIVGMPGVYTEDFTLKNNVNLVGYSAFGGSGQVTQIVGKMIDNGVTMNCTISGLSLKTNSDYFLSLSGSGSGVVFERCDLRCSNHTGINLTIAANNIYCWLCEGDLMTTGIGYFTGPGSSLFVSCEFSNSGNSTTASTSSGSIQLHNTFAACPFSTSSSGSIALRNSNIDTSPTNTASITTAGTGSGSVFNSRLISGTASAMSIGSGTTLTASYVLVSSSNTNAITGAGTLVNCGISFDGTSSLINTTTQTAANFDVGGISFDGGATILNSYVVSTFTPVVKFGGGSTNITYSTQTGNYVKVGKLVMFNLSITLTSKGVSTGTATIGALPTSLPSANHVTVVQCSNITAAGGYYVGIVRNNGGATDMLLQLITSGGAATNLADTNFANNTVLNITGMYQSTT